MTSLLQEALERPTAGAADSLQLEILRAQIDLLRDVNAQLGLTSNPYGVMVAVLSALVAVGAVGTAVLLWRQGADAQRLHKEATEAHRKVLDGVVSRYERVLDDTLLSWRSDLDMAIADARAGLEHATGAQAARIRSAVERLESKRGYVAPGRSFSTPLEGGLAWVFACVDCGGAGRAVWNPTAGLTLPDECAHCGAKPFRGTVPHL